MSSSSSSSSSVSVDWQCLSSHVSIGDATAAGTIIGRSSNASGLIGSQLLIFGGENQPRQPIDDVVHIFDLDTKQWRKIEKQGDQVWPAGRIGHAGVGVANQFYILGGRGGLTGGDVTFDDLYSFDITTSAWTLINAAGTKPPPLSYHVMSSYGQFIYVFGGCTNDHGRSNGLYRFDTIALEWTTMHSPSKVSADDVHVPCGRGGPALASSSDKVYVAFGFNGIAEQEEVHSFDLSTMSWTLVRVTGNRPAARSVTDIVALQDGLFVFGGEFTPSAQGHDGAGEYHADAALLDVESGEWKTCKPSSSSSSPPIARGWFNTLPYGADRVVVFGGFDGVERRNDVYVGKINRE